jgi:festuclavine dehydrogenase
MALRVLRLRGRGYKIHTRVQSHRRSTDDVKLQSLWPPLFSTEMSLQLNNQIIVLTGGTGKVSSRIAPLLSAHGNTTLVASRSGTTPSLPCCQGVKFDWLDSTSYTAPFEHGPVSAIFLVAPPIMECFPPMKMFIDLAIGKGTKRFVLLSVSVPDVGDGPIMGQVANYIISLNVEYAILKPTWFMENFSEMQHASTIREQDTIITATGEGKVPFVSVHDIAAVAFRALTDRVPHNADHDILGPELFSYDDVCTLLLKNCQQSS